MSKETCGCGRGKVSAHDGKCGNCRTKRERLELDKKWREEENLQREREKLAKMCFPGS